ncbi:unnamed protein product, partial [Polarella glacialis]
MGVAYIQGVACRVAACASNSGNKKLRLAVNRMAAVRGVPAQQPNPVIVRQASRQDLLGRLRDRSTGNSELFQTVEALRTGGLLTNAREYVSAITACRRLLKWDGSLLLLSDLCSSRLAPDLITCGAVISTCERALQWEWALWLLDVMPGYKLKPDVMTCSAAISACAKSLKWELALGLLHDMDQGG